MLRDMLDPAGPCACDALILGCTELSVLNEAFPLPPVARHRRAAVLVDVTVERAKARVAQLAWQTVHTPHARIA